LAQPSPGDTAQAVEAPPALSVTAEATAASQPVAEDQGQDGVGAAAEAETRAADAQEPATEQPPQDDRTRGRRRAGRKSAQPVEREATALIPEAAAAPEPASPAPVPEAELPVSNSQRRSMRAARKQPRAGQQAVTPDVPASTNSPGAEPPAPAEDTAASNGRGTSRSRRGKAQADSAQDGDVDQPIAETAVASADSAPVARKTGSRSGRTRKPRTGASAG